MSGKLAALWVESTAAKALPSLPWPKQNPAGMEMAPRMQEGQRQREALPLRGSQSADLAAPLIMNFPLNLRTPQRKSFLKRQDLGQGRLRGMGGGGELVRACAVWEGESATAPVGLHKGYDRRDTV